MQQHRGTLVEGDTVEIEGRPVISATRTALEVTTLASVEASLCVADDFLHRKLTTPEQLASRYQMMTTWPATLTTDLVIRLADPRHESVGETRTGYLIWREDLPRAEPQFEVYDENGVLIARLDFAWPEYQLFLEFDGVQKYVKLLGPASPSPTWSCERSAGRRLSARSRDGAASGSRGQTSRVLRSSCSASGT